MEDEESQRCGELQSSGESNDTACSYSFGAQASRCAATSGGRRLVFPEITFGTLTVSATCRRSVLRGKSEDVGNRMQQGRELFIPIFLPVNLALRVSQAAGTYFEDCYLFCSRNCNPSALLSF
jgi:hypothetical protein